MKSSNILSLLRCADMSQSLTFWKFRFIFMVHASFISFSFKFLLERRAKKSIFDKFSSSDKKHQTFTRNREILVHEIITSRRTIQMFHFRLSKHELNRFYVFNYQRVTITQTDCWHDPYVFKQFHCHQDQTSKARVKPNQRLQISLTSFMKNEF